MPGKKAWAVLNIKKVFMPAILLIVVFFPLTLSCAQTQPIFRQWNFRYDFDSANQMMDLFPSDLSAWTNFQCVEPVGSSSPNLSGNTISSGSNVITLDKAFAYSGTNSLRFEAPASSVDKVSKAAIAKEGMDFVPADTVTVQFMLYLEGNAESVNNVFFFDLESNEIDPGFPGRRMAFSGSEEVYLESKNAGGLYGSGPNFLQPVGVRVPFPKDRWVSVKLEIRLSRDDNGSVKIWQDNVLILSSQGKTFASETDVTHYNWVEFGLTANSSTVSQRMWIDDVSIASVSPQ